jgi:hypothetical protein
VARQWVSPITSTLPPHLAAEVVPPVPAVHPGLHSARHLQCSQCPKCPAWLPSPYTALHCRQELKRKLETAEDSDIVEQGKATLKSIKKELRLLQKAEEEHDQGESERSLPLCSLQPACPSPHLTRWRPTTLLPAHPRPLSGHIER